MFRLFANQNCIASDDFNVVPANSDVIVSSEKTAAFAFAPNDYCNEPAVAGVNFNIADMTESAAVFLADYFLVPKVGN